VVNAGAGDDVIASNTLLIPTEIHGQAGDDILRGGSVREKKVSGEKREGTIFRE
jgi:hypothetical protein